MTAGPQQSHELVPLAERMLYLRVLRAVLAAAVVVDATVRLVPGVLGHEQSAAQDTFSVAKSGLLEGPQYTRPPLYRDHAVPPVLLSGNHAQILRWRQEQGRSRTSERRPDLLSE